MFLADAIAARLRHHRGQTVWVTLALGMIVSRGHVDRWRLR
jgi:hypothetical protein